jgi:hypothetical protein
MDNDFREQFNGLRPQIRKQWLKIIIAFSLAVPFIELVSRIFGEKFVGIFFFGYGIFYLYLIMGLLNFKCPNCSKSLYVTKYVGKIPLIVQSWVSANCHHCGVKLK